jgi:hypothetical protein
MKSLLTVLLIILCSSPSFSQSEYDKDVESIDSIIEALYASISGEKGEERDWDRFRNLFIPEAKLIPTGVNNQGVAGYSAWGVEEYIPRVKPFFFRKRVYRNGSHKRSTTFQKCSSCIQYLSIKEY